MLYRRDFNVETISLAVPNSEAGTNREGYPLRPGMMNFYLLKLRFCFFHYFGQFFAKIFMAKFKTIFVLLFYRINRVCDVLVSSNG